MDAHIVCAHELNSHIHDNVFACLSLKIIGHTKITKKII